MNNTMTTTPLRPHPEQFTLILPWTIDVWHGDVMLCDFDVTLSFMCWWEDGQLWHTLQCPNTIAGPVYQPSDSGLHQIIRRSLARDGGKITDRLAAMALEQGRTNPCP